MADRCKKTSHNIPGRYYVDRECIACDACVMSAPSFFQMNEESGHAYVVRQPNTADEERECQTAMEGCPVEAIGSDGD